MRNINHVIGQMLVEIPSTEEKFRKELRNVPIQSIGTGYDAPELVANLWDVVGVCKYVPYPGSPELQEWHKKVVNIWTDSELFKIGKE